MLYNPIRDFIPLSFGSAAVGSTGTWTITRQPRRLEALAIRATVTLTGALAGLGIRFGALAAIKQVRVRVNDARGSRNAVQVAGHNLVSFLSNTIGFVDRDTQAALAPATGAATFTLLVPFRHPQVGEPFGNVLSIPLDNGSLAEDLKVEIDFAGNTEIAASSLVINSVSIQAYYRETPAAVPYIPSELSTASFVPTTVTNVPYEFANVGVLTSILLQSYTSAFALASPLATGGQYRLEYGRDIRMRTDDAQLQSLNDFSRPNYPTGGSNATNQPRSEAFFDFITDYPGTDAYSANSVLNLDSATLAGDKCRLFFNDYAVVTNTTQITTHRLLPKSLNELKALTAGI
jgi:hypothetical protein